MKEKLENLKHPKDSYNASDGDKKTIRRIYDEFVLMRDVQNKTYKYFNDRSLTQFVDDSERRFNGYVPSKKSQGKENWQANFFHPTTRNKTTAILASAALDVPEVRITAKNEKNEINMKVARIVKDLVKSSYDNENKEENSFFEDLECAVKGTVISYDGYLRTKVKRKEIKSYDVITGAIEYEEKEYMIDEGCQDFLVPLENFFVYSAYIRDLQKQPACIWTQYMNQRDFAYEFGNYTNFKFVKEGNELVEKDIQQRYFFEDWNSRTKEYPIEVIRYYNKISDEHIIIANGVLMLDAPMLLGKKRKYYPFAKTIYSPFSGDFFWGNSLPNTLMGEQDIINSLYNMATDKTYKSLVTNLLIGNTNKDDFDLEDETITLDTKIYVQDIAQVKEMPNSGLSSSDFKMIEMLGRGLDLSSVDANQQGVAGRGVTAREIVIANENARKLKGIFFLFITSLWMQKIKIRMLNVLTYYTDTNINSAVGPEKGKIFKKFVIENTELSDGTRGNKGIIIAKDQKNLPTQGEINQNVDEYKAVNKGVNYEEVAVTSEYLNDWEYKIKIVPESVYQKDGSYAISKIEDKLKVMSTLFPQYFKKNQEKLFKDTITSYDEDPDEYDLEEQQPEQQKDENGNPIEGTGEGQPGATGAQPGQPVEQPPIDMSKLPPTMQ